MGKGSSPPPLHAATVTIVSTATVSTTDHVLHCTSYGVDHLSPVPEPVGYPFPGSSAGQRLLSKKRILYDTRAFIPFYAHRTGIAEVCYSLSSQSETDSVEDWTMDAVCDTP